MPNEYKIKSGQSIWDIALQTYSDISYAIRLIDNENIFNVNLTKYLDSYDFAVVRYKWDSTGGGDMDTRTALIDTGTVLDGDDVGFGKGGYVGDITDPYIKWGGDNITGGVEAALINFKKIKEDFPTLQNLNIRTRAHWFSYTLTGNGNMTLEFQTFKGGTMVSDGYDFINSGGIEGDKVQTNHTITALLPDTTGQDIRVIEYDALSNSSIDPSYTPAGITIEYEPVETTAFNLKTKSEVSKNKNYTAKSGQSVFDLAIQLYGDISQAIKILSENNGIESINSNSLANLSIRYVEQDNFTVKHFRSSNTLISTNRSVIEVIEDSVLLLTESSDYLTTETGDYLIL
jgi:hypothetical protein